eukprot:scaffold37489_cov68-Phaeocystis_antarctica.AAC.2
MQESCNRAQTPVAGLGGSTDCLALPTHRTQDAASLALQPRARKLAGAESVRKTTRTHTGTHTRTHTGTHTRTHADREHSLGRCTSPLTPRR